MASPNQAPPAAAEPTTSDYWWPFAATTTSMTIWTTTTNSPVSTSSIPLPTLFSSAIDFDSMTTNLISSTTSMASSSVPAPSSSPLISLSALPPDPSGSVIHSLPKIDLASETRMIYILAPVLAMAGVILGASGTCLWFRIRNDKSSDTRSIEDGESPFTSRTRKRLTKERYKANPVSGPQYTPVLGQDNEDSIYTSTAADTTHIDNHKPSLVFDEDITEELYESGSPSKRSRHGSAYHPSSIRSALQGSKIFGFSSLMGRRDDTSQAGPVTLDLEADDIFSGGDTEKPLMPLFSKAQHNSRASSTSDDYAGMFSPPSEYGSKTTAAFQSPRDRSYHPRLDRARTLAYGSELDNQSQTGSMVSPRSNGFRIIDDKLSPRILGRSKTIATDATRSRALPQQLGSPSSKKLTSRRSYLAQSLDLGSPEEDKFTALPVPNHRKHMVKRSETQASVLSRESIPLPMSPPQIMSPPLESQLFFTKSPTTSSFNLPVQYRNSGQSSVARFHTHEPSPSTIDFRVRMMGGRQSSLPSSEKVNALPLGSKHRPSGPGLGSPLGQTPRQRHEVRARALSRVEEIVSRSYSQQQLK